MADTPDMTMMEPTAEGQPMRPSQDPNLPTLMGLPPEASKDDIIEFAVMALATLQNQYNALQTEHNAMLDEEVTNRIAQYADIVGEQQDYWKQQILLNRSEAISALESIKNRSAVAAPAEPEPSAAPEPEPQPEPLRNRINPLNERAFAEIEKPSQESTRAAAIRNRAELLRRNNPAMTFRLSWEQAEKEIQ